MGERSAWRHRRQKEALEHPRGILSVVFLTARPCHGLEQIFSILHHCMSLAGKIGRSLFILTVETIVAVTHSCSAVVSFTAACNPRA